MKNQNIILAAAMIAALTVPGIQSMAADPSVPAEYSGNAHEFGEYEEFLPDVIAQQLEIGKLRKTAFSKYYLGRLALEGSFPVDR